MPFLSPFILFGLALAAVPVIIHLLNRRRFLLVDWAPMRYLKLTIKTNRRRLRIEQLILLAVRTLAVIVLILAVARPVLSQGAAGRWLGGRGRTARVIVIDDSPSMGYQVERRSAFESARDAAAQVLKNIGAQDSVTVFTTSLPDTPLVRDAHLDDPARLLGEIGELQPNDVASNWAATFRAVDACLASAAFPVREVVVVTDLRRSGWGPDVTELANRWARQSTRLRVIDVGSRATQNTSLLAFEQEDPVALPNTPINLRAQVRNDGPSPITAAQAILTLGESSRPVILPDLPPGKTTDVPLSVNFAKPGQYAVSLRLPADVLPQDDVRWLSISVRPNLDLVLVDGEPSAQPFESATDFLATAFGVGNEPWRVGRKTDAEWSAARIVPAEVTALANVASIAPERVAAVEKLVAAGMGLMIFVGDQVDGELYNQRLYRDGAGLLPCRLEKPIDEPVTGLVVEPTGQSPLAPLRKIAPEALTRVVAKRYLAVALPPKSDSVRVLARWNDPQGRPAVIEKRFGKGTVLLFTVTADKDWTDWPIDPTYVLAVRSAALSIARGQRQDDNLSAGQPLRYVLSESETATIASATLASNAVAQPATIVRAVPASRPTNSESPETAITFPQTPRAGVYTLTWKDAAGKESSHVFCVNADKSESELEPIGVDQLEALLGNLRPTIIRYGAQASVTQSGREIWHALATWLLILLVVESALAAWVGRER